MAVAFSDFPVKKTAVDASPVKGPCQLQSAVFVATAAAAACLLSDEAVNDLVNFGSGLGVGRYPVIFTKPLRLAGYQTTTLTNGILYLYID